MLIIVYIMLLSIGAVFGCEIPPGQWYSHDKAVLEKQLNNWLLGSDIKKISNIKGPFWLVVPHAGYAFSGPYAAAGYAYFLSAREIDKVILLAPLHSSDSHSLYVPSCSSIATVLGDLPLKVLLGFSQAKLPQEHAFGNQLPFLYKLGKPVYPLFVGHASENDLLAAAMMLKQQVDEHTLIVVSSDLSHVGKRFDVSIKLPQATVDQRVIDAIKKIDILSLEKAYKDTGSSVCGIQPLRLLLMLLQHLPLITFQNEQIAYATSDQLAKDANGSVGYGVVAGNGVLWQLPVQEQQKIIKYVGDYFTYLLTKRGQQPLLETTADMLPFPYGVFVTVRNGEALRGCLGTLDAQQLSFSDQLKQKIKDLADGKDSRFEQLSAQELPDLRYEVSVLMPPRLTSYESFYIHDGIILKKDGCSALYLPEVIVEAGWDKKTGLEQLSKKAGLDAHAWKTARLEAITSFLIR